MQQPPDVQPSTPSRPLPSVVLVYEDVVVGVGGADVVDGLLVPPGMEPEYDLVSIRLNWLKWNDIRDEFTAYAVRADLVVMALRFHERMPVELGDWCSTWMAARRGRPGTMAMVMSAGAGAEGAVGEAGSWIESLGSRARQAGLQFIFVKSPKAFREAGGVLSDPAAGG